MGAWSRVWRRWPWWLGVVCVGIAGVDLASRWCLFTLRTKWPYGVSLHAGAVLVGQVEQRPRVPDSGGGAIGQVLIEWTPGVERVWLPQREQTPWGWSAAVPLWTVWGPGCGLVWLGLGRRRVGAGPGLPRAPVVFALAGVAAGAAVGMTYLIDVLVVDGGDAPGRMHAEVRDGRVRVYPMLSMGASCWVTNTWHLEIAGDEGVVRACVGNMHLSNFPQEDLVPEGVLLWGVPVSLSVCAVGARFVRRRGGAPAGL